MKLPAALILCLVAGRASAFELDDFFDRLDSALTFSTLQDNLRVRLSGTIDFEGYHFSQPAPSLIDSKVDSLFNPRLTLFLDAQLGSQFYFFAQSRVDRGFDPGDGGAQMRLDEYALRFTPWPDGRLTLELGKFATVVGNWIRRHLSWENPFLDAPLVYENITPISDKAAPRSAQSFLHGFPPGEKYEFNPVIWGPSYSSGVAISGQVGQFDYAAEIKNASLSSRPESWSLTEVGFGQPSFDGRVDFRPNQVWTLGLSAGDGAYYRPEAEETLPRGSDRSDDRELLLGEDITFAWRHLQIWAEFYEARFEVPRVGDADTFAYYLEAKYKFTPQLFAALRWNQQFFGTVAGDKRWSDNLDKIDVAATYRFTSHTQLKLQYSFEHETTGRGDNNHILAAQFTVRF